MISLCKIWILLKFKLSLKLLLKTTSMRTFLSLLLLYLGIEYSLCSWFFPYKEKCLFSASDTKVSLLSIGSGFAPTLISEGCL